MNLEVRDTIKNSISGLKWAGPERLVVDSLISDLAKLAEYFRVDPPVVNLPEEVLAMPLTADQNKSLDDLLGPVYAGEAVADQESVLGIEIEESNEPMVSLRDLAVVRSVEVDFSDAPYPDVSLDGWAGQERLYFARDQVAEKFMNCAKAANVLGLKFRVMDAFRPKGVLVGIMERRFRRTAAEHADWTEELILQESQSKTALRPVWAGHAAGAAIDALLYDLSTGEQLPLGNDYSQGGALVALDCPAVTVSQWKTRQLYKAIMEMGGLTVYSKENWHASWGDVVSYMGKNKEKAKAIYGPLESFDLVTGTVVPFPQASIYETLVNKDRRAQLIKEGRENGFIYYNA
jgi:D-alanyl-D-alanine dipeptidase